MKPQKRNHVIQAKGPGIDVRPRNNFSLEIVQACFTGSFHLKPDLHNIFVTVDIRCTKYLNTQQDLYLVDGWLIRSCFGVRRKTKMEISLQLIRNSSFRHSFQQGNQSGYQPGFVLYVSLDRVSTRLQVKDSAAVPTSYVYGEHSDYGKSFRLVYAFLVSTWKTGSSVGVECYVLFNDARNCTGYISVAGCAGILSR
ncbi:hypothetical protein ANN_11235 [Periplaneta americana]|uniref:Uncharacterized protein n=1 Tax=Periplaneta americana TaxID=6978 RepID=A0ABQ8T661_PERAM|nr:hypothetical protein ANN_11235 [Periplaneta americana]